MSIMELGALGEFVGSVGVIATLIYLAIQIRQNTSATRAGVRQGVTEQANQYISMGLDNRVVAKARTKQRLDEPLDPHEEIQLINHQHLNFRAIGNAYAQYKQGFFSEAEWQSFQDVVYTLLRDNGSAQAMWKRTGQAGRAFPRDFIEFVEDIRLRVENETK